MKGKICYAFGDFGYGLVYIFLNSFILVYLTNVAKIPVGAAGTLVLLANVFDAISDPIVGFLSDRTHTKLGRYRPWIMFAVVPAALLFVLTFFCPDMSTPLRVGYCYATYLLWTVAKTCAQVPYSALSVTLTDDSDDRAVLGVVRDWAQCVAGVAFSVGAVRLVGHFGESNATGYHYTVLILAVVNVIAYGIVLAGTKEKPDLEREDKVNEGEKVSIWLAIKYVFKNKYALALIGFCALGQILMGARNAIMAYYCVDYLDDTALSTMSFLMTISFVIPLILEPFVPKFIQKTSRRLVMIVGAIVMGLVGVISFIAGKSIFLVNVSGFVMGIGMCFQQCVVWGAMPDAADYGYYKYGINVAGILTACVTLGTACATGVSGWLTSLILRIIHYSPDLAVQSAATSQGLYVAFALVPIILAPLMILCASVYKLDGKMVAEMRDAAGVEVKE